jgi:hypothetical protein
LAPRFSRQALGALLIGFALSGCSTAGPGAGLGLGIAIGMAFIAINQGFDNAATDDLAFTANNQRALAVISGRIDEPPPENLQPGETRFRTAFDVAFLTKFDPGSRKYLENPETGTSYGIAVSGGEMFVTEELSWYGKERPKGRLRPIILEPGFYALSVGSKDDLAKPTECVQYPSGEVIPAHYDEGLRCEFPKPGTTVPDGTQYLYLASGKVNFVGRFLFNINKTCPVVGMEQEKKYMDYELNQNEKINAPVVVQKFRKLPGPDSTGLCDALVTTL